MDGRDTNRDIESRKMSGRSCLWIIIRDTSVGRSIWRIKDGWRRMWHGAMEKTAAPLRPARLCSRACCAAAVVDENYRWSIAATAAGCPAMVAEGIEATVVLAHA